MTNWYQQHLVPAEVIECKIMIGLVPGSNHAQAQVELSDPMTGVLIAQWSNPHGPAINWQAMLDQAVRQASDLISNHAEPF